MAEEKIVIVDFGGQYNQLIARRIRQLDVYSEIVPYNAPLSMLSGEEVKGIIFTGGPNSVYAPSAPLVDENIFALRKPILGICYGAQMMAHEFSGKVRKADKGEYGSTIIYPNGGKLLSGLEKEEKVFMSHSDLITELPEGFIITSSSSLCPIASFESKNGLFYGVQFHPEVEHSEHGMQILKNFALNICHCSGSFRKDSYIKDKMRRIKERIGNDKVLLALSGGVDSSVTAALLAKTIGKNLTCIFVEHGLLRKGESEEVERVFGEKGNFDLNFHRIDASDLFLERLRGVTEPEQKRKIIGKTFIDVFQEESRKLGPFEYLAQGTIYPDRIESGLGLSATIKSHHNVGGLPQDIGFKGLVEPLSHLFKDEVRIIGTQLGLPDSLVYRQPFPGPGLGIRIIGEVTKEKINIVQEADAILREEIAVLPLEKRPNQYFVALSNMKSVGVMGDYRTYDYAVMIRAVNTDDFMTAEPTHLHFDLLAKIADRIVNEVKGVNRVLYDFTSKPPSTIEFE